MISKSARVICVILFFVGLFQDYSLAQNSLRSKIRERFSRKTAVSAPVEAVQNQDEVQKVKLSGRNVAVWKSADSAQKLSPIILFSHGFLGCNTQSSTLMKAIAKSGFSVFAPNHSDALCADKADRKISRPHFAKPDMWNEDTYKNRRDDFREVLQGLKLDPYWSQHLDFTKISLVGHSLGGYTVLGLAGAWPSWKLPNLKAVLALSPYAAPFINGHLVKGIEAPTMFQGGTKDTGITPFIKKIDGLYDQARSPSYYVEFENATHYAWTDLNKKDADSITSYSVKFLKHYGADDLSIDVKSPVNGVSDFRSK